MLGGHAGLKGSLMTQPLTSLSGGQAVRVALARIALSAPHLLVLDEPSNHLDMVGVHLPSRLLLFPCIIGFSGQLPLGGADSVPHAHDCSEVWPLVAGAKGWCRPPAMCHKTFFIQSQDTVDALIKALQARAACLQRSIRCHMHHPLRHRQWLHLTH